MIPVHRCFTLGHYRELLDSLKESGYRFVFFHETESHTEEDRVALFRHDVDVSIEYAYRIAKLEAGAQVKSTFFVMLTSPFYNLSAPVHQRMLSEMMDMGHRIGLHYDPLAHFDEDDETWIQSEASSLSKILKTAVTVFSHHRPRSTESIKDLHVPSLTNAYGSAFMETFKYLSDSNHRWREGCLAQHLPAHKRLYVLTHPIWWIHQEELPPEEKVTRFVGDCNVRLVKELVNNITGFKNSLQLNRWEGP